MTRKIPQRVNLEPGYNPAHDPTVRALEAIDETDEALRMELERKAIEQTENGPKDTDRAPTPAQTAELEAETEPEPDEIAEPELGTSSP